jgi:hypothetical protein
MCFNCYEKKLFGGKRLAKLRVAKRDIKCYKILITPASVDRIENWLYSQYARMHYRIGVAYCAPNNYCNTGEYGMSGLGSVLEPYDCSSSLMVINVGYHSWVKKPKYTHMASFEVMVECRIPKGTHYRRNDDGCYVSDSIVITKIIRL